QAKTLGLGSMPGLNDSLNWHPTRHAPSVTADYNLTTTMFVEGTYGWSFNEIDGLFTSPLSNRLNAGLGDLPNLYPQAGLLDPASHAAAVFKAANSPFYVNGKVLYPPTFTWGNRITNTPPNFGAGNVNINPSHDASASVTKLQGRHTLKAGAYWNRGRKMQQLGTAGAPPFQG